MYMNDEKQPYTMNLTEFKNRVTTAVGYVSVWEVTSRRVKFLTGNPVTLKALNVLSATLGTDSINFNFGEKGSTHYSEVTPGSPDEHGWIEVEIILDV